MAQHADRLKSSQFTILNCKFFRSLSSPAFVDHVQAEIERVSLVADAAALRFADRNDLDLPLPAVSHAFTSLTNLLISPLVPKCFTCCATYLLLRLYLRTAFRSRPLWWKARS